MARYTADTPLPPSAENIQEPQACWTLVPLLEDNINNRQIIVTTNSTSRIKTLVVGPAIVSESFGKKTQKLTSVVYFPGALFDGKMSALLIVSV